MIKVFLSYQETLGSIIKKKLNNAIKDIRSQGANIIIGPINYEDFKNVKKFNDIFISPPSNIYPEFNDNIISIGISLESQLLALSKFVKKQKKNQNGNYVSKNQYSELIEKKLKKLNLNNSKVFKYSSNPEVLTGEIEILTNYSQRKKI